MSKVYYFHTSKLDVVKFGFAPASTIALRLDDEENKIYYGVAICSKQDNFSRKYGREIAGQRVNKKFGVIKITPGMRKNFANDHEMCKDQLFNLVKSVVTKQEKWKRRVTEYNKKEKEPKVVQMNY